ncbi:MAG: hypothetical protein ACOX47_03370 [Bacillota bacterium]
MKLEKGKVCDKGTILLIIGYVFGSAVIVSPGDNSRTGRLDCSGYWLKHRINLCVDFCSSFKLFSRKNLNRN